MSNAGAVPTDRAAKEAIQAMREHDPQRGDFEPQTPRGKSRFEMQARGRMRAPRRGRE